MQVELPIHAMNVDEFAEAQLTLGEVIVKSATVYWCRVRPFFYRPLLPYKAYELDEIVSPCNYLDKSLGGFQHVVTSWEKANSSMNFLILDQLHGYALEKLKHERRRFIKKASRQFEIRPLGDIKEFRDQGYRAYISFYKRTSYSYKAERTQKENFANWVDIIMKSKALVLGGFGKSGLVAVALLYQVEQTLIYATFFSETEALRKGIGELMFHHIREAAAQRPEIHEIFVRKYHGGNGMDKYYMLRGCKVVKKPANLHISNRARFILMFCLPKQYEMLSGRSGSADACERRKD